MRDKDWNIDEIMNHILCITVYILFCRCWWLVRKPWVALDLADCVVYMYCFDSMRLLVLHFETVTTCQLHCHWHYVYNGQLLTNTFWDTKSNLTSDCCCCMFLFLTSARSTAEDGEACSAVSTAFPAKNSPSVCGSQAWPHSHFNKGHSVGLQSTLWVDTSWRDLLLL